MKSNDASWATLAYAGAVILGLMVLLHGVPTDGAGWNGKLQWYAQYFGRAFSIVIGAALLVGVVAFVAAIRNTPYAKPRRDLIIAGACCGVLYAFAVVAERKDEPELGSNHAATERSAQTPTKRPSENLVTPVPSPPANKTEGAVATTPAPTSPATTSANYFDQFDKRGRTAVDPDRSSVNFYLSLLVAMPDWVQINRESEFLSWLATNELQGVIDKAQDENDPKPVIDIFTRYEALERATNNELKGRSMPFSSPPAAPIGGKKPQTKAEALPLCTNTSFFEQFLEPPLCNPANFIESESYAKPEPSLAVTLAVARRSDNKCWESRDFQDKYCDVIATSALWTLDSARAVGFTEEAYSQRIRSLSFGPNEPLFVDAYTIRRMFERDLRKSPARFLLEQYLIVAF